MLSAACLEEVLRDADLKMQLKGKLFVHTESSTPLSADNDVFPFSLLQTVKAEDFSNLATVLF